MRKQLTTAMVALIFCVGCGEAKSPSPVQPTPPVQSSLSGLVQDTAFRGLPNVRVEITDGSQAGTFAITETYGLFRISGLLSGTVNVRASRDGYVTATQQIQVPSNQDLVFRLEAAGPSVHITGDYTLTLLADSTCTALPDVARKRTYNVAIAPNPRSPLPLLHEGILSGATFYRSNDFHFNIGVSGSTARFVIGEYGRGFTEELGSSTVEIWGQVDPSMDGSSSSGSFPGAFTYCDGLPSTNWGTYWSCPVRPAYCEASNHQFTLTRR
jgi:hypothetical protein